MSEIQSSVHRTVAAVNVHPVLKQSVGLDVSKSSGAACFAQQELNKPFRVLRNATFNASPDGFKKMYKWVEDQRLPHAELHFLMEATGVYYEQWAYFLHAKGYRVSVLLPNKTAAYAKSLDYKSKTDTIDAQKLAQMSLERTLTEWRPPCDIMLTIKRLCRERAELVEQKTVIKNRRHARQYAYAPSKEALKRNDKNLQFVEKQIQEIEKSIEAAIAQDPDIEQRMKHVRTIPGIGLVTAATIVSEANGFTLFKNKAQLVSYAGYDVVEFSSGETIRKEKRISKKGNNRIRKALYFAALAAVKKDKNQKNLFQRVLDTTKIKMKGYVAVQRKLLVLVYTLYKNKKDFDLQYAPKTPKQNLKIA